MNNSEAKLMLDDLARTTERWEFKGGIHFSGGEPLVRKDIFDLVDYAKSLDLELRMLSNGTLITKDKAKKLKDSGFKIVQVSIDGIRDTHNYLRNRADSYELAIQGIRNLREAEIEPTVSGTLTKTNFPQIEEIVKNAYEAGAKRIGFSQLVPEGSGKDLEMLTPKELYESFSKLHNLRKQYEGKIDILTSESLWCLFNNDENEYAKRAKEESLLAGGCGVAMFGLSVLSDGTVFPCRRLPIKIGNIKEGIQSIFIKSKLLNDMRDIKNYECKSCEKVTVCRGCRAVAYAVTGDVFAKDPQCFKEIMEDGKTPACEGCSSC